MAGPDRPDPPKSIYDPTGRVAPVSPDAKAKDAGAAGSSVRAASAQMSSGVSDLYNRLGSALAERGYAVHSPSSRTVTHACCVSEMLGNLEEQFNSLEQGSKNMVAQVCSVAITFGPVRVF